MTTNPIVLNTERLVLRPFRISDAADVFEYAGDPEFKRYTPYIPADYSLDDAVSFIEERLNADWNAGPTFAIEREGKVIGAITLRVDDDDVGAVGIGYGVGSAYWGQGIATEAVLAVFSWVFTSLHGKLVYATADAENPASIRVMQKLGMVEVTDSDRKPTFPGREAEVRYEMTLAAWMDRHSGTE